MKTLTLWDQIELCRKEHDAFINHIMACKSCFAPRNRYCQPGKELLQAYRIAFEQSKTEVHMPDQTRRP